MIDSSDRKLQGFCNACGNGFHYVEHVAAGLYFQTFVFVKLNFSVKLYQNQTYISFSSLMKGSSALVVCLMLTLERECIFQSTVSFLLSSTYRVTTALCCLVSFSSTTSNLCKPVSWDEALASERASATAIVVPIFSHSEASPGSSCLSQAFQGLKETKFTHTLSV